MYVYIRTHVFEGETYYRVLAQSVLLNSIERDASDIVVLLGGDEGIRWVVDREAYEQRKNILHSIAVAVLEFQRVTLTLLTRIVPASTEGAPSVAVESLIATPREPHAL